MAHPIHLERARRWRVRVARIVASDGRSVGMKTISGVGKPLRIVVALRAVFRDRKAREPATIRSKLGSPIKNRNRDHRLRAAVFCPGDKRITGGSWRGAVVRQAFKIP